MTKSKSLNH